MYILYFTKLLKHYSCTPGISASIFIEKKSDSEPRVIHSAGPDNSYLLCKTIICHPVYKTLRAASAEPVGSRSESHTLGLSNRLKCNNTLPLVYLYAVQILSSTHPDIIHSFLFLK
jgi:hypothetical protein